MGKNSSEHQLLAANQQLKAKEQQLEAVNEQLKSVLESINDGFFVLETKDLLVTYFNKAAEDLLGKAAEDVINKPLFQAFPEAKNSVFESNYRKAFDEKISFKFETYFGIEPYSNWYNVNIYYSENKISVFFQVITDIKNAQFTLEKSNQKLIASEQQLRAANQQLAASETELKKKSQLIENTGKMARVGGWEVDVGTNEVTWSDETYRIHQVNKSHKPPIDEAINYFHHEDRAILQEALTKASTNGEPYDLFLRFITAKGKHLITRTTCKPEIRDGKVIKLKGTFQDVTEWKEAEEELKRKELLLRASVESPVDMIILSLDKEYRYLYFNNTHKNVMKAAYNKTPELGKCIFEFMTSKKDIQNIRHIYDKGFKGESIVSREVYGDKQKRYYSIHINPIYDENNNILGITAYSYDITEKIKAEETIKERESHYRTLFDNAPIMFGHIDENGNYLEINSSVETVLGYTDTELLGVNSFAFIHEEDQAKVSSAFEEAEKSGSAEVTYRFKDKRGIYRTIKSLGTIIKGTRTFFIYSEDITEKIKAEEELRAANQQLQANEQQLRAANQELISAYKDSKFWSDIVHNSSVGVAIGYPDGRLGRSNKMYQNITGYTQEELQKIDWNNVLTPSDWLEHEFRELKKLHETGQPVTYEKEYIRKNGERIPVELTVHCSLDENGEISFYFAFVQNITERIKAEEELKTIFNTAADGMRVVGTDYKIKRVNDTFCKMVGLTQEEILGKYCYDVFWGDNCNTDDCPIKLFKENPDKRIETEIYKKGPDGKEIPTIKTTTPLKDDQGGLIGIVEDYKDITDRKKQELIINAKSQISQLLLSKEEDDLYACVLDAILQLLNSKHGVFGYIDDFGDLVCPSMTKDIWDECKMMDKTIVFPKESWSDSIWGKGLLNKKGAYSNKPFKVPDGHLPVDRFLTIPLVYQNKSIGLISVGNKASDYTDNDFNLLQEIADYIAPVIAVQQKQKLAEEALQKANSIINSSPVVAFQWKNEKGWPVGFVTENVSELFGYSDSDFVSGKVKYGDLIHKEDIDRVSTELATHSKPDMPDFFYHKPYRIITKYREIKWVEDRTKIRRDSSGNIILYEGIVFDVTEKVETKNALIESEASVRRKLSAITRPDGDISSLELSDILDMETIQLLMDSLNNMTGMCIGITDLKGNILASVGWRDICKKFHRTNPESEKNCIDSDTLLSHGVASGEFKLYKCKNNLWESAAPIEIAGQHIGNIFFGQFFYVDEILDFKLFRDQAKKYGYDEDSYLEAVKKVPKYSRTTVESAIRFFSEFARLISAQSYSNLVLSRLLTERKTAEQKLKNRMSQLEIFNKASVDRELKMIELKKEINRLLEKFGKKAKYWIPDE